MTSEVIRVLSAGSLVFLGLLNMPPVDLAFAAEEMKGIPCEVPHGKNATRAEQAEVAGGHMISGEVMRVDGANYFVKDQSGKEVTLKTDQSTENPRVDQGDQISAYVDNQDHALWIRSNKMTDRRTEHASADCTPN